MPMTKDPVCGMNIDDQTAKSKSAYQGQTYAFCSQECKQKFDAAPQQYAGKAGQAGGPGGQRR